MTARGACAPAAAVVCVLLGSIAACAVRAQDYPARPVSLIVGFPAGGANDTVARIVAQKLAVSWGQSVVVVNRPGAGGTTAAAQVAKAAPDGHTLFVGEFGTIATAGSLYAKPPYDPVRDFAHVTLMEVFPLVLVVPAASPLAGVEFLIEQAKSNPGKLRYGSSGVGTSPHLFAELINFRARTMTVHVPYKGGAPSLVGVVSGEVEYSLIAPATALAQLGAGKLRALGVTSMDAAPRLPGVPPISKVLPGYEGLNFHGLHAPPETPRPVILKIQQEVARTLRQPDVAERLDSLAMTVRASTPEEYAAFVRAQTETWSAVIRAANVRAD